MFAESLSGGRGREVLIIKSHYRWGRTCLTHPVRDSSRRRCMLFFCRTEECKDIELAGTGMLHMISMKREVLVNLLGVQRVELFYRMLRRKQGIENMNILILLLTQEILGCETMSTL